MSDIKFNCPHCQQRLSVPEAAMGHRILCPICTGPLQLPEKKQTQTEPGNARPEGGLRAIGKIVIMQKDDIKFSCPKCDVHIVIADRAAGKQITCQRCGAQIRVPLPASPSPAVQPSAQAATPPSAQAATPPSAQAAAQPVPVPVPDKPDVRQIPELIESLRSGDVQAGKALIQLGEPVISALVEGFKEYTLEEPDRNKGADYVADLLVKCGAVCVRPLIAKLGKSSHAYSTLGRIGNEEAVTALARELDSVNWHRVDFACRALSLVTTPCVLKIVGKLETVRKSTRVGEVYVAAGNTLTALAGRFNKETDTKILKAVPLQNTGAGNGSASITLMSKVPV